MSAARQLSRQFVQALRSPLVTLLLCVVCGLALAYSYQANAKATEEATVRSQLIEAQNMRLQSAFCGLVEGYAYGSGTPTTERGFVIQKQFANAATQLQCTPDPTDGK